MNNAKTKFIIAVTQRLSAAPDSDAKVELIEELSENLYSRYQDMVSAGMPEGEAYDKALGELGDVNELLAYLGGAAPGGAWDQSRGGDPMDGFAEDVEKIVFNVGDIVRGAVSVARDALDTAQDAIHVHVQDFMDRERGQAQAAAEGGGELTIPSQDVRSLQVELLGGDVAVQLDDDPEAFIRVCGDTEHVQTYLSEDGTLVIRQTDDKTASGHFFFSRMMVSENITLTLPKMQWDSVRITTVEGDVDLEEGLCAESVHIKTVNGDVTGGEISGRRLQFKSTSGDVELSMLTGDVQAESMSGDITLDGVRGTVDARTMSGDVDVYGSCRSVRCSTASGDVQVCSDVLPEELDISSKSGDCEAAVPDGAGFTVQFRTVSGGIRSDFPLTGQGKHGGAAIYFYLDGGERTFRLSSISGDVALRRQP